MQTIEFLRETRDHQFKDLLNYKYVQRQIGPVLTTDRICLRVEFPTFDDSTAFLACLHTSSMLSALLLGLVDKFLPL